MQSENGLVFFYDKTKRDKVESLRFSILLQIPESTKLYFKTANWWKSTFDVVPIWIELEKISNLPHAFQCNNAPGSKSILFTPPFFLTFRAPSDVSSNYLLYNNMLTQNSEDNIVAMLSYDDTRNVFNASSFAPGITLRYKNCFSLNNIMEFKLYDSLQQQIAVSDKSQLYIDITLL